MFFHTESYNDGFLFNCASIQIHFRLEGKTMTHPSKKKNEKKMLNWMNEMLWNCSISESELQLKRWGKCEGELYE